MALTTRHASTAAEAGRPRHGARPGHPAEALPPRGAGARRPRGHAGEASRDLARRSRWREYGRAGPPRGARAGGARPAARRRVSRSWLTTARSGSTPISASCRWRPSRTASTPPTPPARSSTSSTTAGPASSSWRTRSSSTRSLEVRGRCPELVKIFVFDMEGLHGFRDDQVMTFERAPRAGRRLRSRAPRGLRSARRDPAVPRTSPSWSTPPAPPGRPRARC